MVSPPLISVQDLQISMPLELISKAQMLYIPNYTNLLSNIGSKLKISLSYPLQDMLHKKLIRILGQKIYLNADKAFALAQTNLAGGSLTFGRGHDIFWEVAFDQNSFRENTLTLIVTNYHPSDTTAFAKQPVAESLHKLCFKGIHWGELLPHLISYMPNRLFQSGAVIDKKAQDAPSPEGLKRSFTATTKQPFVTAAPGPKTIVHKDSASIRYEDAEFHDSYISFAHRFDWYHYTIKFTIENPWLKKEYDYIRFYFARAMGDKHAFNVDVTVTITEGKITEKTAASSEINKIDSGVIDSIKYHRIMNLIKEPSIRKERSLFSADDIFDNFENENAGNIFKQTGEELLHYILANRVVRNEQQLKCLSGELHSRAQKLRFTLNPFFGFLFYLEGRNNHFFCWELLDSHATYLWSFPRGADSSDVLYKIVEEQISIVETIKREQYRKLQKEQPSPVYRFIPLEHTKVNESVGSFKNWKEKLETLLIT
jgi:hypothetical protein